MQDLVRAGLPDLLGRDGQAIVWAGTEKQLAEDIAAAKERWTDYKRRKNDDNE